MSALIAFMQNNWETLVAFFFIPLAAALITALTAAPLGNLLIWRRLVYFGETIAHSSLLGIALSLLLGLPPYLGIWVITLAIVLLLYFLRRHTRSDGNTILGSLSHLALACGYIIISRLENIRTDLTVYLFGDILATQAGDLLLILILAVAVLTLLYLLWQPLILITLSSDIANAELKNSAGYDFLFLLLLGLFIGFMAQFFGLLLVIALLIIPANTASRLARTPEQSVIIAAAIAAFSALAGTALAWWQDWPPSPSIVLITGIFYLASLPALVRRTFQAKGF